MGCWRVVGGEWVLDGVDGQEGDGKASDDGRQEHEVLYVLNTLDRLSAGGHDDVAEEQARLGGRTTRDHLEQAQAPALLEALRHPGRQRGGRTGDAQPRPPYPPVTDQLGDDRAGGGVD